MPKEFDEHNAGIDWDNKQLPPPVIATKSQFWANQQLQINTNVLLCGVHDVVTNISMLGVSFAFNKKTWTFEELDFCMTYPNGSVTRTNGYHAITYGYKLYPLNEFVDSLPVSNQTGMGVIYKAKHGKALARNPTGDYLILAMDDGTIELAPTGLVLIV